MATWGLRGKSLLALLLACLIAIVPTGLVGFLVFDNVQRHFSQAYARNMTLLNREKVYAPVSREYALASRFAHSVVVRQFLLDENDSAKRELFFEEAKGWRQAFLDHSYFLASAISGAYYFNSENISYSEQPRQVLRPEVASDQWFYNTMSPQAPLSNINVDTNATLKTSKVWFNFVVSDGTRRIGVAGTGLDLSSFIRDFVHSGETGVVSMIVGASGTIQAHPDESLIALNSGSGSVEQGKLLFDLLDADNQRDEVRQAMTKAAATPGSVELLFVEVGSRRELLAVSYIKELDWYIVNLVDLDTAHIIDKGWMVSLLVAMAVLLLVLLAGVAYAVERLVLRPISRLERSARAMAAGQYDVALPVTNDDEIGKLSQAFGVMADKVRSHTSELEERVRQRTQDLAAANLEMAAAHKKISDSIDYASQIQQAILPRRDALNALGERYAVLWRPRDVVGGDFYLCRVSEGTCLFGVVDCAGHGVPGALMTMLAHAALEQALTEIGIQDPAGMLTRVDQIVRAMLGAHADGSQGVATNMDIGLAFVDLQARQVTFSGAKIGLYHSDGKDVQQVAGARRAIGDKRAGDYTNTTVPLQPGRTFYMTTDGFLDQAGGEFGYGFGNSRFAEMIRSHASLPLAQQGEAFRAALASYQGELPQRDDVTMLCFRFD